MPPCPIVSCIDSPCQKLSRYLLPILNPLNNSTRSFVLNSQKFVKEIINIEIEDGAILCSFDVVNFFITTPDQKAL
jgi:hypothetical protein